jgi:hypothetical protein
MFIRLSPSAGSLKSWIGANQRGQREIQILDIDRRPAYTGPKMMVFIQRFEKGFPRNPSRPPFFKGRRVLSSGFNQECSSEANPASCG